MKKKLLPVMILLLLFCLALPAHGQSLDFVTDELGLLTPAQLESLNRQAQDIASRYPCRVYALLIHDYEDYGYSVESAAEAIYRSRQPEAGDAIILLISLRERDYVVADYGSYCKEIVTDYGMDLLEDSFLPYLGDNDWAAALEAYLTQAGLMLEAGAAGSPLDTPLSTRIGTAYGIALAVGLLVATIVCLIFKSQMNTARLQHSADAYILPSGVQMRIRTDRYTHTTRTQRKIETQHSSGGGGSSANHSRSGKF